MILIKEISQKKRSYKHDENMKLIKASAKLSKNTTYIETTCDEMQLLMISVINFLVNNFSPNAVSLMDFLCNF